MASFQKYEVKAGTRWMVRYRDPDSRQSMKRGFKTRRDAEAWWSKQHVAMGAGAYVRESVGKTTLAQIAEQWFKSQVQLKATTRSNYRQSLDSYVLPRWGARAIGSIRRSEVQTWVTSLSDALAPASVRVHFGTLRSVMKSAVVDGILNQSPCDVINLPRIVKGEHVYLTHEQVDALAEAAGPHGDIVLLLAYTGLRFGELAALRVRRVNMLRRRIEVREAVADVRGKLVFSTPKNHAARQVVFPAFLSALLAKRMEGLDPDDLIFTGPTGGSLRHSNFRKRVFAPAVAACRKTESSFPAPTPHDLRHTAASLAVSAGANVKAVQRMLGHADAAMTLNTYADLFEDDLDSVADRLSAARDGRLDQHRA